MADIRILILALYLVSWAHTQEIPNDPLCGTVDNTHENKEADHCPTPWMITVCIAATTFSGTIIDSTHILITASCFSYSYVYLDGRPLTGDSQVVAIPGLGVNLNHNCTANSGYKVVSHLDVYPGKQGWYETDDLVILTLASQLEFNRCQRPICMTNRSKPVQEAQNCKMMRVNAIYDWQRMPIPVKSDSDCSHLLTSYNRSINTVFCTPQDMDPCHAERGSAFICQEPDVKYYLYGIMARISEGYCKNGNAVYIRLSFHLPWINSHRISNDDLRGIEYDAGTHGNKGSDDCPYPWMVNICSTRFCSGIIIDSRHILTAAFCVVHSTRDVERTPMPASNISVVPGFRKSLTLPCRESPMRLAVSDLVIHPNKNLWYRDNDLAILRLASPIEFNKCHRPICMTDGRKSGHGAGNCTIMKAGDIYEWQGEPTNLLSDSYCNFHDADYGYYSNATMLCSRQNSSTCPAEPGGAFACQEADGKYCLYGVVSWISVHDCTYGYAYYSRVSHYVSWINRNLNLSIPLNNSVNV